MDKDYKPLTFDHRRLLVMRHAKAVNGVGIRDFDRPLSERGETDTLHMGRWLKAQRLIPQRIIASPARRTEQTALSLVACLDLPNDLIQWEETLYEANVKTLMGVLTRAPKERQIVLLMGHNPGLEQLVGYLSSDPLMSLPGEKLLPTAAIAQIDLTIPWSALGPRCGQLVEIATPKFIR